MGVRHDLDRLIGVCAFLACVTKKKNEAFREDDKSMARVAFFFLFSRMIHSNRSRFSRSSLVIFKFWSIHLGDCFFLNAITVVVKEYFEKDGFKQLFNFDLNIDFIKSLYYFSNCYCNYLIKIINLNNYLFILKLV